MFLRFDCMQKTTNIMENKKMKLKSGVKNNQASLFPILSINFVGTLGFSIVLPFLIFLVTRFGGNAFIYGIMGATYSVFQLIGAPILGTWSDKYGRRKILLFSQIGTLLSWAIFLLALFLPIHPIREISSTLTGSFILTMPLIILFVSRALDGITGGNVSVANAYLADISDKEHRSKNFGKMAASANMGYILGPAFAGILGATALGEILPVLAAFVISLIASILIAFLLPESNIRHIESIPKSTNARKILGQEHKECFEIECKENVTFWDILKLGRVSYVMTIYFLVFLGFNFFYIAFPVHAVKSLDWSLAETGFFFSFIGLTMAFVQGPVLKRATKMWSDSQLVVYGSFILALSFLFYRGDSTLLIYSGAALLSLGNGLMWSSILSILSTSADERYQGAIQGFAGSAGSLASIIGLLAGGLLYQQLTDDIFILSSIVLFMVFLMSLKFLSKNKKGIESMECKHLDRIKSVKPSSQGCMECSQSGDDWVHLRICLECGHVGCCDSSKNKHATRHYNDTGHTIIQSFEQGENWGMCYSEGIGLNFENKKY